MFGQEALSPPDKQHLLNVGGSDSDEVKEFELPPPRSKRPRVRKPIPEAKAVSSHSIMSVRCCLTFVLFGIALAMALACAWFLLSMQSDLQSLRVKLESLESADHGSVAKNQAALFDIQKQVALMKQDLTSVGALNERLETLNKQLQLLEKTVQDVKREADSSKTGRVLSLARDIESLKSGMADTGSDIEKLKSTTRSLTEDVAVMRVGMRDVNEKLFNVTVTVSELAQLPVPVRVATPSPVVVTLTPNEDVQPYTRKEVDGLLAGLKNAHKVEMETSAAKMTMELYKLNSNNEVLSQLHTDDVLRVSSQLDDVLNRTTALERMHDELALRFDAWVNESTSELRHHELSIAELERHHDPPSTNRTNGTAATPWTGSTTSAGVLHSTATVPFSVTVQSPTPSSSSADGAAIVTTASIRSDAHDTTQPGTVSDLASPSVGLVTSVEARTSDVHIRNRASDRGADDGSVLTPQFDHPPPLTDDPSRALQDGFHRDNQPEAGDDRDQALATLDNEHAVGHA